MDLRIVGIAACGCEGEGHRSSEGNWISRRQLEVQRGCSPGPAAGALKVTPSPGRTMLKTTGSEAGVRSGIGYRDRWPFRRWSCSAAGTTGGQLGRADICCNQWSSVLKFTTEVGVKFDPAAVIVVLAAPADRPGRSDRVSTTAGSVQPPFR